MEFDITKYISEGGLAVLSVVLGLVFKHVRAESKRLTDRIDTVDAKYLSCVEREAKTAVEIGGLRAELTSLKGLMRETRQEGVKAVINAVSEQTASNMAGQIQTEVAKQLDQKNGP